MAVPFNLPTQEETEENYQILDQLFVQLYEIVRQIILRRRQRGRNNHAETASAEQRNRENQRRDNGDDGNNEGGASEPSVNQHQQQAINNEAMLRVSPLPDIVLSSNNIPSQSEAPIPAPRRRTLSEGATERPQPPPRRPRRRRGTCCNEKTQGVPTDHRTCQNWQQVGKELRKIADEFHAASPLQDEGTQTTPDLHNMKEESLLSLLVPAPFRGSSVWAAVIFIVGWRIVVSRDW